MDAEIVRWALTGLMGIVLYFFKRQNDNTDHEIALLKLAIKAVEDTRLHKDDFREFKTELRGQFEEIKQAIRDLKPHG